MYGRRHVACLRLCRVVHETGPELNAPVCDAGSLVPRCWQRQRKYVSQLRGNQAHEARGATLLAWVAGFVDAVGYLALGRLFVANMTGNTVVAVTDLARQE